MYPYIGVEELRHIPLAVLSRLNPVPTTFLKQARQHSLPCLSSLAPPADCAGLQLAADMDLFRLLPRTVQRQVWETDGLLFRRHASLSLEVYGDEVATVMRELDMVRTAARSAMSAAALTNTACAGAAFSTAAWANSARCSWQGRPRQAAARAAQESHP